LFFWGQIAGSGFGARDVRRFTAAWTELAKYTSGLFFQNLKTLHEHAHKSKLARILVRLLDGVRLSCVKESCCDLEEFKICRPCC
jgi:hypothetical protein